RYVRGASNCPVRLSNVDSRSRQAQLAIRPDYHQWAEAWATDSIKVANRVYVGCELYNLDNCPRPRFSTGAPQSSSSPTSPQFQGSLTRPAKRIHEID